MSDIKTRLAEIKRLDFGDLSPRALIHMQWLVDQLEQALEKVKALDEIAEHHVDVGECEYCKLLYAHIQSSQGPSNSGDK